MIGMNLFGRVARFIICLVGFVLGFNPLHSFSFIPLSLAALGLPLFGKAASSAKHGVRKTLNNVDNVMLYAKLFLALATFVLCAVFITWFLLAIRRHLRNKKIDQVMKLLYQLQSDLVLLHGVKSISDSQKNISIKSIREAARLLKDKMSVRFLKKKLGKNAFNRMLESLVLIESGKMDYDGQIILVDQWLRTFDLMSR